MEKSEKLDWIHELEHEKTPRYSFVAILQQLTNFSSIRESISSNYLSVTILSGVLLLVLVRGAGQHLTAAAEQRSAIIGVHFNDGQTLVSPPSQVVIQGCGGSRAAVSFEHASLVPA